MELHCDSVQSSPVTLAAVHSKSVVSLFIVATIDCGVLYLVLVL